MDVKEKLKTLPHLPGVYVMKDSDNSILYVGKSKNLKNRVSSYFQSSKAHSPKINKLVKHLKDFDFVITDTEFEAFILECKLIKELKPLYNRLMKNPLSYTYIKISKDYLNIEICSEKDDVLGNYYFGPYNNKSTVENALEGIKETCKIKCSSNYKSNSPCLNYSLGKCIGVCFDASAKEKYPQIIEKIAKQLEGKSNEIINEMDNNMITAAESLDFNIAANYRDYIAALKSLIYREKVIDFAKENENIVVCEYLNENNIKLFLINGTEIIFSEKYNLTVTKKAKIIASLGSTIMALLKDKIIESSLDIGKNEIDETKIIYSYLNSKKAGCNNFIIPKAWILHENITSLEKELNNLLLYKC